MIGLHKDLAKIVPYDPTWRDEYNKEKEKLCSLLDGLNFRIEHVGSTSITGLAAKPIIDIAIGANSLNELLEIVNRLKVSGYEIIDNFNDKGEFLTHEGTNDFRTHYIHIELIGSDYWREFVYFKKYLLEHPKELKEYQNLKENLAQKYHDERKKYTAAKHEFITKILQEAYKIYNLDE